MDKEFCISCGHQVFKNAHFCSRCGKNLTQIPQVKQTNNTPFFKSKPLIIGIIVLVVWVLMLKPDHKNSPEAVVVEFIELLRVSDYDSAERLWSESGKRDGPELLQSEAWIWQRMVNLVHHTDGSLYDYEILDKEVRGKTAKIVVAFVFEQGQHEDVEFY